VENKGGAPVGNFNARKGKIISDAIHRAITQSPDKLRKAIDRVLNAAADGDLAALDFIANRTDGKPAQSVDVHATVKDWREVLSAIPGDDDA